LGYKAPTWKCINYLLKFGKVVQHLEVWEYFVYVDDPAYMFFDFVHQQIAYFDAFSEHTANLEKSKMQDKTCEI